MNLGLLIFHGIKYERYSLKVCILTRNTQKQEYLVTELQNS